MGELLGKATIFVGSAVAEAILIGFVISDKIAARWEKHRG